MAVGDDWLFRELDISLPAGRCLVNSAWLVGAGDYFAALPCAATLAQLRGVPSLRRWLGCTDLTLRLVVAVLAGFGVLR